MDKFTVYIDPDTLYSWAYANVDRDTLRAAPDVEAYVFFHIYPLICAWVPDTDSDDPPCDVYQQWINSREGRAFTYVIGTYNAHIQALEELGLALFS